MEMNDSAMHGILDMQTKILEEIRDIRRRDEMRNTTEQMEKGINNNNILLNPAVSSPIIDETFSQHSALGDIGVGDYQNESINNTFFDGSNHYPALNDRVSIKSNLPLYSWPA